MFFHCDILAQQVSLKRSGLSDLHTKLLKQVACHKRGIRKKVKAQVGNVVALFLRAEISSVIFCIVSLLNFVLVSATPKASYSFFSSTSTKAASASSFTASSITIRWCSDSFC